MNIRFSGKALSVMIGLFAIIMMCFSAGISVPLVKKYDQFRPEMLLIIRGFAVVLALLVTIPSKTREYDVYSLLGGILLSLASITFFQAVNIMGANPVITIITLTPVGNFFIALGQKTRIDRVSLMCLALVLVGVTCALYTPHQRVEPYGLILSIIATVSSSFGMECWSRTKTRLPGKMMTYSVALMLLAFVVALVTPGNMELVPSGVSWKTALYVFSIIGCLGGIVYFCSASIALERLPVTTASILLQGETPSVLLGSWIIAGQGLSWFQSFGVGLMLCGIIILTWWTVKQVSHFSHAAQAS